MVFCSFICQPIEWHVSTLPCGGMPTPLGRICRFVWPTIKSLPKKSPGPIQDDVGAGELKHSKIVFPLLLAPRPNTGDAPLFERDPTALPIVAALVEARISPESPGEECRTKRREVPANPRSRPFRPWLPPSGCRCRFRLKYQSVEPDRQPPATYWTGS